MSAAANPATPKLCRDCRHTYVRRVKGVEAYWCRAPQIGVDLVDGSAIPMTARQARYGDGETCGRSGAWFED